MAKNTDIATKASASIAPAQIENRILTIRGIQVMIDRDIAELYGIPTKRLNEQVKRNKERFPEHFCFQLSENETNELVANCDRLQMLKHSSVSPYCFTEQGVAMLSAVLRTETAVRVSVQIMEAFVEMRHTLAANAHVLKRLEVIEHHQLVMAKRQDKAEDQIEEVFRRLDEHHVVPSEGIFYAGQIYDAFELVERLIKSAKKSIVLIDNYVDESVLTMMSEKNQGVQVDIYTKDLPKALILAATKFKDQYEGLTLHQTNSIHDRFFILDEEKIYLIGASLKDAGKRLFAFTEMSSERIEELKKVL